MNFLIKKSIIIKKSIYFFTKIGKPFDRNIGFQIFEIVKGENEKMNLLEFIDQYLDTEDTLNFRINLDKKKIEELVNKKEEISHEISDFKQTCERNGELLKLYSLLKLTIKDAYNLESKVYGKEANSYVKIIAGDRTFYSVRINEENNPVFNQTFQMLIFMEIN